MKTIHKYPIPIRDRFSLSLPYGSKVVHAECQAGATCMWVAVDTDSNVTAEYQFYLAGTGHPLDEILAGGAVHIASFQQPPFVWHLFGDETLKGSNR